MKDKNLKLIAKTDEDLRVISAHLQDSIASAIDIASLKDNRIFLMQGAIENVNTKICTSGK